MWRPESDALGEEELRELEAIDRVLAGDPTGRRAELAELVLAVRDDRPPLRPAFADELDRRRSAGFPRRRPAGPAGGSARRIETRHWLGGLGVATAVAVAAVVVAGPGATIRSTGHTPPQTVAPAAVAGRAPQTGVPPAVAARAPQTGATGAGSTSAGSSASASGLPPSPGVPPAPGGPSGGPRAVQRDAALALLAPRGHVQDVVDRAIAAVDRLGGIVQSSNVTVDDQGGSQANLDLRVPSAALDRTLSALSALGHVSSRSQSSLDITDPTGAARDRLAQSRAERDALLRQLAQATGPNQVASIHARLGLVSGRIAADQAQLQALVGRAGFAELTVTIGEDQRAAGGGGSSWGPAAALDDALAVLEAVFAVVVIGLSALVPAGVLVGLGWLVTGPLRRRRRDAALAAP